MGLKNRIKEAAKAPGEVFNDVRDMGFLGAGIKRIGVFSSRNVENAKTLGDDIAMTRS